MEPYHHKKDEHFELGCYIDEDGVIQLKMNGNLGQEYQKEFEEWSDAVKQAMRTAKQRNPEQVLTIIDLVGATIVADQKTMPLLVKLIEHNKDYATKTGVYGAGFFTRHLIDIALKTTSRDNMKVFDTREEAEEWVFAGTDIGKKQK